VPEPSPVLFVVITLLAVAFGFTNGINDAANAIATVVGTRVLSPRGAIIMASVFNFAGAATGTAVAATIGKGLVAPEAMSDGTLVAALASIVIWGLFCTRLGLPISLSHGLVAALVGAALATSGAGEIQWGKLQTVLIAVAVAPVLGFVAGFFLMLVITRVFSRSTPASIRNVFGALQIAAGAFMAYSHGKNDGQMPIGVITAGFVYYTGNAGHWDSIPTWITVVSALSITTGTAVGGQRVIRTLGLKMTKLRPVHGFAASTSAAGVIEAASAFGIPVSTTHCMTSSIMGVGATRGLSAVRWGVAWSIVSAWLLTFPACLGLGWLMGQLFKLIVG
jgi:inorganic phosphate transporter, PiT family